MPDEALQPCAYHVVRYQPNLIRDEWVNIGVLLLDPSSGRAAEAIRDAERLIKVNLEKDGVKPNSIPELAIPVADLTERTFSPQEGFVISRINGQWDVKSIMKISPMKELEVMMIFQRMLKSGVIKWKKK